MEIYRSFDQWKNGNVLENGQPRLEFYSEEELSLIEMGWNYGFDAGLVQGMETERALNDMAKNAKDLGLDYGGGNT
jgi:hypothetical protein